MGIACVCAATNNLSYSLGDFMSARVVQAKRLALHHWRVKVGVLPENDLLNEIAAAGRRV